MERPAYRALFLVVVLGVVLACTLPEAVFVLPAVDALGLDLVTILVAFELRHYLAYVVVRTNPVLWIYQSMWVVIWIRTLMGKMPQRTTIENAICL